MTEEPNKEIKSEKGPIKESSEIYNKQLKIILITLGTIILIILIGVSIVESVRSFDYNGIKFNVVKEGKIIFYQTSFPIYSSITGKHTADYNIYIRNDPRKLENIPINGKIDYFNELIYINITEDFICDGKGVIAIANLAQTLKAFEIQLKKDSQASCDSQGRYTFVQIQASNVTNIEQFGPSCYYINVNNCEILEATERFMLEFFPRIQK